jgi:hypothetical protein
MQRAGSKEKRYGNVYVSDCEKNCLSYKTRVIIKLVIMEEIKNKTSGKNSKRQGPPSKAELVKKQRTLYGTRKLDIVLKKARQCALY